MCPRVALLLKFVKQEEYDVEFNIPGLYYNTFQWQCETTVNFPGRKANINKYFV